MSAEVVPPLTCEELRTLAKSLTSVTVRDQLSIDIIERVVMGVKTEKSKPPDEVDIELLTECVRVLRNLVAGVTRNQIMVAELLNSTYDIWDLVHFCLNQQESGRTAALPLLRCSVQLIGNLSVGQTEFQADNLWKITSVAYQIFSRSSDLRVKNYTSMVLLNVVQNEQLFENLGQSRHGGRSREENVGEILQFVPIWLELMDAESQDANESVEFAMFCLQSVSTSPHYFPLLPLEERMHILHVVRHVLDGQTEDDDRIPTENLSLLSRDCVHLCDTILTTNQGGRDLGQSDVENVAAMLEILAIASARKSYVQVLQAETSLLVTTVYLLKMVHSAGESGAADFSQISKMSEIDKMDKTQLQNNPSFGFKANLIKLIANLVWENEQNKSLVGELDGVALILDCSRLDARNPFITQWVVVAMKALCAEHRDNQAVLAGLRRQGVADTALIKELGLDIIEEGEEEGSKIKIVKKAKEDEN